MNLINTQTLFSAMKNKGEILSTILKDYNDCYIFLHNTREFTVVESIINDGFIFESQLSHSTDSVNPNDPIEITYFLFQRKEYGHFTIIIAIPKTIYDIYTAVSNTDDIDIEEVMSITDPYIGDNDEFVYTLPPEHVLGYFNIITNEFIKNKNWNPGFNSCNFQISRNHTLH